MAEQTVGWALHALEPDEELEVVEHLPGCPECRRAASDVAEVGAALASALPQQEPPARLRESIVDLARRTPQEGRNDDRPVPGDRPAPPRHATGPHGRPGPGVWPAPRHAQQPGPEPDAPRRAPQPSSRPGGTGGGERPPAGPGRGRPRTGRWARSGRVLVAGVLALAVIAGGGVLAGQYRDMQAERDVGVAQAQQMHDVLLALSRPGSEHAWLAPDPGMQPVAAVIVADGQPEVVPLELSPNRTDDQTYVLWGLNGDNPPTPVGTFDVLAGAPGPLPVASLESGTFGQYAVSLERGREAPSAPSAVIAAGQVET
ncbi:anti-sigma factor [Pseudonocardia nematodicida]|uniref:Regulator of SigK n=1 Tax=Pseudonocardia nematodicida TaxID=1206997 RepID=A0ABV1K9C8_9PSEU